MIADNTTQDFAFFLIIPIITIISIMVIIKAIAKFSKAIGYHQPDLGTNQNNILERDWLSPAWLEHQYNRKVYAHACVSWQNASCARAVVLQFAELTGFFLWKWITDF